MPRAYSTGSTPVLNVGGGGNTGDAWIMGALNTFEARRQAQDEEARQRAELFGQRLGAYKDNPEMAAAAAREFSTKDPEAGKYLTPFLQQLPQTAGQQLKTGANEWLVKMAPLVEKAYETDPTSVNPQLLSLMRPYFSGGDKAMEPHEYDDLTQRYTYGHQGELPTDYVKARRLKDKLEQTPEEIAVEAGVERGQDLGLAGKRYDADQQLTGTKFMANRKFDSEKYGVDAKRDVYSAEAGMLGSKGHMYESRAGLNEQEGEGNAVDQHPAVQAIQQKITALQKERDADVIAARNGKLPPAERQAAQQRAGDAAANIRFYQDNLEQTKVKMRKSLGIEEGDAEEPSANSGQVGPPDGQPSYLGVDRGASPKQPRIRDMRGSNVPSRSGTNQPQNGGQSVPPQQAAPDQQVAALAQQLVQQGQIDQGKKTMTRKAADLLKKSGVSISGYTIVGQ